MSPLVKRLYTSAVAGALLLAAAACADRATAPAPATKSAEGVAVGQIDYARGGRYLGTISLLAPQGDTARFTVDPTKSAYYALADGHYLYVPAYSICDLGSTYGPAYWNTSCNPLKGSIVITAQLMEDADGQPFVDFQPAMRFAPSSDQSKWVWLFLYDQAAATTALQEIDYCFGTLACVDESALDATLMTHRASGYPYLYRRVKHFSGYNVVTGEACTPSPDDPYCVDDSGFGS